MPHKLTELKINTVTKTAGNPTEDLTTDVCVVGAGISGLSAAVEARRLGRTVVLADALPLLGGQCVNSIIGLFCGVYGNAPEYRQLTHGIFDPMFADLAKTGDVHFNRGHTMTVAYDEVVLGRWVENLVQSLGIQVVLGASVLDVEADGGRIDATTFATRHGLVRVRATGFVDASGDASLTWEAGLPCRVPERTVWGSQQIRLENLREEFRPDPDELVARIEEKATEYGLVRRDGLAFFFPGRNTAVMNMTHVEAPLEAVRASSAQMEGRAQADRVVEFMRREFPKAFGEAKVRSYGFPGRRQTRWIAALHQLSVEEVRSGFRFEDAVARTAWPIELHDRAEGYVWETFDADHVHYVPLRSLIPVGAHNLVAAGRCVDGDAAALSSVRVMGPCAAMGFAAAHAVDLAGDGGVQRIDPAELRERVQENVDG
ncbi:FAD-dependent oxidoreductase [Actinomadura madurae]|uniref:FAD-dependent oxidoreductase n=1 Tax=Actinomadura madurae TaxID=1993 RepID=UPI002025FCC4|nr:FAD-dependent oxidoreductase [Actinomadura madurae]MCP9955323.1 FAD-dependent oxidoreductase [Actinomadura madurae]MCP9972063.1 FAD-dependent oxidoreductase [Actinomadura madurae]MCP9984568.1 FAD-dependent oxidoreductase [Actinomadura madurae]MCQ0003882.1 FAD-dependent oxidoreductase [Actinomadura madurae]MCQ0020762.1 FAD-dependent oxidoreductase [Actinomadura madurae]